MSDLVAAKGPNPTQARLEKRRCEHPGKRRAAPSDAGAPATKSYQGSQKEGRAGHGRCSIWAFERAPALRAALKPASEVQGPVLRSSLWSAWSLSENPSMAIL